MEILIRVAKKSLIIILLTAAVSAFFEWEKLPPGIIAGGLFGVLTLRGIVRSVERFINSERAAVKIIFFNMSRLVVLFMALFILIWTKAINVFGMLFGFTVVFVLILTEGMKVAKER